MRDLHFHHVRLHIGPAAEFHLGMSIIDTVE